MTRNRLLFTIPLFALLFSCGTDPKSQSAHFTSNGNKFYERGKVKEASIMYRRALQKDMKNAEAWYKLGLISTQSGAFGDARLDFIRVADLADSEKKYDATTADALAKLADVDYLGYVSDPGRLKDYKSDLDHRAEQVQKYYPNTFDAYRIQGLSDYATALTSSKPEDRKENNQKALDAFKKADALKPFSTELGYAIVVTLAEAKQVPAAEKYAAEMIVRKTADDRVFNVLYQYYMQTGNLAKAEEVRKNQVANNPKQGGAYVALAQYYGTVKKQPEMVATLNKLTSDLKTFPNAYMLVGDFYSSRQDYADAIPNYERGVDADKANKVTYRKKLAEALTLAGRSEEASKVIDTLLKDNSKDSECLAMDGALKLNTAQPRDADKYIAVLQPLIAKATPTEVEKATILHFNLGRAYALKGDPQSLDQARLQFQEAVNARLRTPYLPALMALSQLEIKRGENPQAVDHAGMVLSVDPGNFTARLVRTMGLAGMGQIDRARLELEQLVHMKPDSRDARFQLGRLDLLQKRYADAEAEFEKLRKVNDQRGLAGIVECKVQEGKSAEALQMLEAELARDPGNVNYRNGLATLYYSLGQLPKAAAEYRKLAEQNPNVDVVAREDWYLRLGETLRRLGDNNGAIEAFHKAGEIQPKNAAPRLEIGLMYQMQDNMAEARKVYEEVLKLEPDNPIALNNLAYSKADAGTDLDQALAFAQRARSKAPNDPNIMDTLGLIYFKKDLIDDSVQLFSNIVNKAPDNALYHLHLAMALHRKGDSIRARHELDLANRNRPSGREQAQIKDLMSKIG